MTEYMDLIELLSKTNTQPDDLLEELANKSDILLQDYNQNRLNIVLEYLITYQGNEKIDAVIKKYLYIYKNIFNNFLSKLDHLEDLDDSYRHEMFFLIGYILNSSIDIKIDSIVNIFNICTKNILNKKNKNLISEYIYIEIFEIYMQTFVNKYNLKNVIVDTQYESDVNDGSHCSMNFNGEYVERININKKLITEFYNNKNVNMLITISHEIEHMHQFCTIRENIVSNDRIMMIKDKILSKYLNGYYEKNYLNISYEIDAILYSEEETEKYLKQLGFNLKNNQDEIKKLKERKNDKSRIDETGKITTLDILFDKFIINHPEELETYPQLNFLYYINDGKVLKKDFATLMNDFENIKNNDNILDNEKNIYKEIYKKILLENIDNEIDGEIQKKAK